MFIVYLWGIEIMFGIAYKLIFNLFIVYLWGIEIGGNCSWLKNKIKFIVYLWGIEIKYATETFCASVSL